MIPFDIVLQGPFYPYTLEVANSYSSLPFVNCVIISCWDSCSIPEYNNPRVFVIKNRDVDYPGNWNRNRLIKSSLAGIDVAPSEFVVKMRTDQIVSLSSMSKMYEYYLEKRSITSTLLSNYPNFKIGVMGICLDFPYHPIDHIFWGNRQDIYTLFDIQYDMTYHDESSTDKAYDDLYIRSEVYIASQYVAKYNTLAEKQLQESELYLKGNSPNISESLENSKYIMDELFLTFPPIRMQWPKAGLYQYHYDVMSTERGGHTYWDSTQDFRE